MPTDKLDKNSDALRWRRTKIVATLGPASESERVITQLLKAGVDVVRLNMSHSDHDSCKTTVARIRKTAQRLKVPVAIIMDLCGPKIRVGKLRDGELLLTNNSMVTITARNDPGPGVIPTLYKNLYRDVKKGERIMLDDGNMELKVMAINATDIKCKVIHGGILKNNKGINLPDTAVSATTLTEKDKKDALLGIKLKIDYIALSFVRSASDVTRLKNFLAKHKARIPVISKIERPEAVDDIEHILDVSYGIMIARGDLGIELPAERVPIIQQDLIARARLKHVPVIVATQMLESMISHSRPTRAEVNDVANAAISSADAVMLSAETASGQFPLEAVQTMDTVLREIEQHSLKKGRFVDDPTLCVENRAGSVRDAVARAALDLEHNLDVCCIIIPTSSGATAGIVAAHRTLSPMIGICSDTGVFRRLSLHWGVIPVQVEERDIQDWNRLSRSIAKKLSLGGPGDNMLLVSGFHDDPAKSEPVLKIVRL